MLLEQEKLSFELESLIDCTVQDYRKRFPRPPRITFWGLSRIFSASGLFPASSAELKKKTVRLHFLKELFEGSGVDPNSFMFCGCKERTQNNYLTKIWHLTWKYEKPTERINKMVAAFQGAPHLALDGVKRNIERLIWTGNVDPEDIGRETNQLISGLYPDSFGDGQREATRVLAVLALLCLLGDDVVLGAQSRSQVCCWADGKSPAPVSMSWEPIRSTGIYHVEEGQIDVKLLPDIICEGVNYTYQSRIGSPLCQIIAGHREHRWFFLCGQAENGRNSAVSGAGKTTTLRYLAQELKYSRVLWLPLAEIYDRRGMQDPLNLIHYIERHFHVALEDLPVSALLLFDGLDELYRQDQLDCLSGDLARLQDQGQFGLVVSSKLPWERLPGINILYNWSSVWNVFLRCTIQELTEEQRLRALPLSRDKALVHELNTPFLVSLYRHTASLPDDPRIKQQLRRWGAESIFSKTIQTKQELFYHSLIVQILRWFEAERGQENQWEADAFFLLHTLPVVAYQMQRNETAIPELDPASGVKIDRVYLNRIVEATCKVGRSGLELFPGYRGDPANGKRHLKSLSCDVFLSGAIPSLFYGEWDNEDPDDELRFINNSLRSYLANLHVADVFLLALNDRIDTTAEMLEACGSTMELMPAEEVRQVAEFFRLIAPEDNLESLLVQGPKRDVKSPLSRFLAGHISATMCQLIRWPGRKDAISSEPWCESMTIAWDELQNNSSQALKELAVKRLGLAYIYGQVGYARNLRDKKDYIGSGQCAQRTVDFQAANPIVVNSDGNHLKATNLWSQIQAILNGEQDEILSPIDQSDLAFADKLAAELNRLERQPGADSEMFPALSSAHRKAVPLFSMMLQKAKLRRDAYAEKDFLGSQMMKFLCRASYVAKAHDIYAACCAGASGMAHNLLGSLMANDCESFENDSELPFFKCHPDLHLHIANLQYQDRLTASFQIYACIYNVPRGPQPYPARRLSELLLRRQVRLDSRGEAVAASGEEPFTEFELDFLERSTIRAVTNSGNSETYWRARYLHDRARKYGTSLDSARQTLRTAWEKCGCEQKLARPMAQKVDIISVLVILEDLALSGLEDKEKREHRYRDIFDLLRRYRNQINEAHRFVTGTRPQYSDIQDCLRRMEQLRQEQDRFVIRDMAARYGFELSSP